MTECGKKKPKNPPRHRLALAKVCQLSLLSRTYTNLLGFLDGSAVKNLPANAGDARDAGLIPVLGIYHGGGHGNPRKYSARIIPWTEEPGRLQSMGLQRA